MTSDQQWRVLLGENEITVYVSDKTLSKCMVLHDEIMQWELYPHN